MLEAASKRVCIAGAGLMLAAGMAGVLMAQPAHADTIKASGGASVTSMAAGKVYKNFDLNGDGFKDTIKYEVTKRKGNTGAYSKLVLNIDGLKQVVTKNDYFYDYEVRFLKLAKGKGLVSVCLHQEDDFYFTGLYTRTTHKAIRVFDGTTDTFGKYGSHETGTIVKVKHNKIVVRYGVQPYVSGITTYRYAYKFKNNAMVRTSSFANAKASFYKTVKGQPKKMEWSSTTKAVKLYSDASCGNCTKLAKKTQAKVVGVYITASKKLVKIQTKDGATGYVNAKEYTATSKALFAYAMFAG